MKDIPFIDIPFHDSKRTLHLYECVVEDHLAVQEWLDRHLRGDYLFKKNHLKNIITRPTSVLFAILYDGLYVGTAVVYNGSVLHNIMVAEEYRGLGIGEAVIKFLAPSVIRAKTNMVAGDPVPFYQKMGYEPSSLDKDRPHIVVMHPRGSNGSAPTGVSGSGNGAAVGGAATPLVVDPPEVLSDRSDAEKWRALKARQRARQAKRKAEQTEHDTTYARRYLPPSPGGNGVVVGDQSYNTSGD